MSLDSMALLVDAENYFGVSISDSEARSIYTIQNFVDVLYKKVRIDSGHRCKSQMLFYKFRRYFNKKLGVDRDLFLPASTLQSLVPVQNRLQSWHTMQADLRLQLPTLVLRDINAALSKGYKVPGFKVYGRSTPVMDGTVKELVHCTLALNYRQLLNSGSICNKEELQDIFIGIISESVGIPVHEIAPHHRFTDDLGID